MLWLVKRLITVELIVFIDVYYCVLQI